MKHIFSVLILCAGLTATVRSMEKMLISYQLNSGDAQIVVSGKLVAASSYLKKLAKTTHITIDVAPELFPLITFVDKVLDIPYAQQIDEIKKLKDEDYPGLLGVVGKFDLQQLLCVALQAYQEKSGGSIMVTDVPTCKTIAASCVGKHLKTYDQQSLSQLPIALQHAILCNVPLNGKNFQNITTILQELNVQHKKEFPEGSLMLLDAQYNTIAHILGELQSAKKIFMWLEGKSSEIKLKIVCQLLRAEDITLSKEQRFKIGWRIAMSVPAATAFIDELAYFLLNHHLAVNEVPVFLEGSFSNKREGCAPDKRDFFWIRSGLMSLVQELRRFVECKDKLPSMDSINFDCSPISNSFIRSYIEQLLQDVKILPKDVLSKKIDLFKEIIKHNATPQKNSAQVVNIVDTLKKTFSFKSLSLLNRDFFCRLEGLKLDDLSAYRVGCSQLAKFSKIPFKIEKVDTSLLNSLNKKFISVVQEILKVPNRPRSYGWQSQWSAYGKDFIEDGVSSQRREGMSLIKKLLDLLVQGADINVQDEEGNAIAHLAFTGNNSRLLFDFLQFVITFGLSTPDMHCKNKQGYTPVMLMQSMVPEDYLRLHQLCLIAKATHVKLCQEQIAKVKILLDKETATYCDLNEDDIVSNSLTCYEETLWRLAHGKMTPYEKIRFLWRCAVGEKNPKLRTKLFGAIRERLKREDQRELPQPFYTCESLDSLYSFVKDYKKVGGLLMKALLR